MPLELAVDFSPLCHAPGSIPRRVATAEECRSHDKISLHGLEVTKASQLRFCGAYDGAREDGSLWTTNLLQRYEAQTVTRLFVRTPGARSGDPGSSGAAERRSRIDTRFAAAACRLRDGHSGTTKRYSGGDGDGPGWRRIADASTHTAPAFCCDHSAASGTGELRGLP